jgi:hypothetical protein
MNPIDLLLHELNEFQRALIKSFEMVKNGSISQELHETHVSNLTPIIEQYKDAIEKLKK